MKRRELERMTADIARTLNRAIKQEGEGGRVGFALIMFDFVEGPGGSFAYAANAERNDVIKLLREAAGKIERA